MSGTPHSARVAQLRDGPRNGERVDIHPGQLVVSYTESIVVDQGPPVPAVSRYVYERMLDNKPDTALFVLDA
jgi:hypothetical protein